MGGVARMLLACLTATGCEFTFGPIKEHDVERDTATDSSPPATTASSSSSSSGGSSSTQVLPPDVPAGTDGEVMDDTEGLLPNRGDCCAPTAPTDPRFGCNDPGVEACVCAEDDYCCTQDWDELCVKIATLRDCAPCPVRMPTASCCDPQPGRSCIDDAIAACVCASDIYCCEVQWDESCVELARLTGCAACPPPDGPDHDGPDHDAENEMPGAR